MGMRQLGAPVKHETSHTRAHSSALHPGRAGVCQARQQPLWRRHEAPARRPPIGQVRPVLGSAPAAVPGPWVGARQWPFLGSVPPPPRPAPARPRRRQVMGPQSPDHRWTAKGMDGGRKSPYGRASCPRYAARAARGAVRIVAIRVAREGRSSCVEDRRLQAVRCRHSAHGRKRL